jgi:hypothetical protein
MPASMSCGDKPDRFGSLAIKSSAQGSINVLEMFSFGKRLVRSLFRAQAFADVIGSADAAQSSIRFVMTNIYHNMMENLVFFVFSEGML